MNTIRLSVTPQLQQVMGYLKTQYPPLSDPEILKVALSELYQKSLAQKNQIDLANLSSPTSA